MLGTWDAVTVFSRVVVARVVDGEVRLGDMTSAGRRVSILGREVVEVCLTATVATDPVGGTHPVLAVVARGSRAGKASIRVAVVDRAGRAEVIGEPAMLGSSDARLLGARARDVAPVGILAVDVLVRGSEGAELLTVGHEISRRSAAPSWRAAASSRSGWLCISEAGRLEATTAHPVVGAAPPGRWESVFVSGSGDLPTVVLVGVPHDSAQRSVITLEAAGDHYEQRRDALDPARDVRALVSQTETVVLLTDDGGQPVVWLPTPVSDASLAPDPFSYDVFISYKRGGASQEAAQELYDRLRFAGLRPFMDKGMLRADWQEELLGALKSSRVLAVILTDKTHIPPEGEEKNQYSELLSWGRRYSRRLDEQVPRRALALDLRTRPPLDVSPETLSDRDARGVPRRMGFLGAEGSLERQQLGWLTTDATVHDVDDVTVEAFTSQVITTVQEEKSGLAPSSRT